MNLTEILRMSEIADDYTRRVRTARIEYVREQIGLGLRPIDIAKDLRLSRQHVNNLIHQAQQPQPETAVTP